MNLILNTFHKQLYSEACIPKSLDVHMAPTDLKTQPIRVADDSSVKLSRTLGFPQTVLNPRVPSLFSSTV